MPTKSHFAIHLVTVVKVVFILVMILEIGKFCHHVAGSVNHALVQQVAQPGDSNQ